MHPARSITMKYRMQYAITNWTRLCRLEKGVSVCGWWARKGCAQCGLGGICVSVVEWGGEGEGRGPWGPPAFIKQLQFQSPVWHICTRWAKAKLLLRGIAALEHEHDGTRITTRSLSCPLIALPLTTYKSLSCSLSGKTLEHRGANEQFYSNDTLSLSILKSDTVSKNQHYLSNSKCSIQKVSETKYLNAENGIIVIENGIIYITVWIAWNKVEFTLYLY